MLLFAAVALLAATETVQAEDLQDEVVAECEEIVYYTDAEVEADADADMGSEDLESELVLYDELQSEEN